MQVWEREDHGYDERRPHIPEMESGNPVEEPSMRDVFQHLIRDLRVVDLQCRQRVQVPEDTAEKRRILPFGDAAKAGGFDVRWDSAQVALGALVPSVHHEFRAEAD